MTRLALRVERRRFISVMIALAFCLSAMFGLLAASSSDRIDTATRESQAAVRTLALTPHAPILIDGNAGFTNASGVVWGSGTEADPFIIEGWDISGPRGVTRISILNADAYFVIRGCSLHDSEASSGGSGVGLTACRNGTIEACTSFNHDEGIIVRQSTGIVVRDCYCFNNSRGISVSGSELCLVTNNTCADGNQYGIYLEDGSGNNTAIGNNCSYNDETGISMSGTWNNTVSYNTCEHGSRGFEVSGARSNTITNNQCRLNDEQGIYLYGTDNSVFDNDCSNNIGDGIYLVLSSNNTLINNNCSSNHAWGIFLDYSSNNTLNNNNCSSNGNDGMMLESSSNNNTLVSNQGFWNVYNGIDVVSSRNNTLVSNNWSSNGYDGAYIGYSTNNTLDSNNCSSNNRWGIQMGYSSGNVMLRNQLCDNIGPGMYIHSTSSSNIVFNNTFIGNNGAGSTYDSSHVQAYDDGTSNWWNDTEGYGNYWSDWISPDVAPPYGIVDVPYSISGTAGAKDFFPQTAPQVPIPEFGVMPFVVMVLLVAIVLTIGARRRKAQ